MISAIRAEPGPTTDTGTLRVSVSAGATAGNLPHSAEPAAWMSPLEVGLQHRSYLIEAFREARRVGHLPLALVKSRLFGRLLVSLPYLNTGGVVAENSEVAGRLIDQAVELAAALDLRYLELRHERP